MAQGEQQRGPRVRRGDVRAAILDVVRAGTERGEPVNGYQVIQEIAERSGGAWRPSPGSVYPTIQQLEDEGLVEADDERGRRTLRLTAEGEAYVAANPDELASVWAPFESERRRQSTDFAGLKPEIGQVMGAVWQIVTTGTDLRGPHPSRLRPRAGAAAASRAPSRHDDGRARRGSARSS